MVGRVLLDVTGWLHVLLAVAGVAVAALSLRTPRWWSWALVGGFGLEALASLAYRILPMFLASGALSSENIQLAYLGPSLVSLIGQAGAVTGLAGCLLEPRSSRPS